MALQVIDESYNGLNALHANAGEWVTGQVKIRNWYSSGSGTSNTFQLLNGDSIVRQQGNWSDDGWVAGMTITIRFTNYNLPPPSNPVTVVKTITYINGNIMYLDTAVAGYANSVFPTSGSLSGMLISAVQAPETIEFLFNLTLNGAATENSIIDGQVNRFVYNSVDTMAVTDVEDMIQQNFQSGGLFKDVTITRETNQTLNISSQGSVTAFVYTIDFKFLQWGLIQNGFEPPAYFNATDCLGTYVKAKAQTENGNPNAILEAENGSAQSNTGYRDENFNGGPNPYGFISIALTDLNGDPIDKIDFSNFTDFEAILDAPNQDTIQSIYRIGLYWAPLDTTKWQALPTNLGENLLLNAPDVDFNHSGAPIPGPWLGYTNPDGARFDFSNLQFEILGGNQLAVRGRITPLNTLDETIDLFEQYPDGERRMVLWVQLGDYTLTGNDSDRVNLTVYDDDNYDAPTLGVQIPNVVSETILDHDGNDITDTTTPNTTTEDDVLYISEFKLPENVQYEGVRARIWAYNTSTQEGFTLEDVFFDFSAQPYVGGIHQVDLTVNRGFLLAPSTDRNKIRIARKPSLDGGGLYGMQLEYGYLSRWEYWLAQANADNDFFVFGDPNNGLNKDWQHYDLSSGGDWIIRLSYYTRLQGVDDYNHKQIKIRPYEDDPNVSTSDVYTVLSNGTTPSALVADELIEWKCTFTWLGGAFVDEWIELAVEDFEGNRIGYISSVLPHGGNPNNVLQPLPGETQLQVVIGPANVATCKCYIDTNLINTNKVSLTRRIFSKPKGGDIGYLINEGNKALLAYSLRKVTSNAVYPDAAPCINVERFIDSTNQDFGFVPDGNGNLVLDTAAVVAWVNESGVSAGGVRKWYDQGGFNNDATQFSQANMPLIVDGAGALITNPTNGLPEVLFDGVDDSMTLTIPVTDVQIFLHTFVFDRTAGQQSHSLGSGAALPFAVQWDGANRLRSGMGADTTHATNVTSGPKLVTLVRDVANSLKATLNDTGYAPVVVVAGGATLTDLGFHNAQYHFGGMQEMIHWSDDQEALLPMIFGNVNAYYTIW